MGKKITEKDGITTILYQKSNHTIYTQSRTCSGISQLCTRSGIMKMKENLMQSKQQYYVEGIKTKRDLSIETDICVLRRYCKKIQNKLSHQEGSKSKYSNIVETEIETVEEYQPDTSACGDTVSDSNEKIKTNPNIDVTDALLTNFKHLLTYWVEKHLLDEKLTKDTLETIMYSLLHKLEMKAMKRPSSKSTYVLNREANKSPEEKVKSIVCHSCRRKITKLANKCCDSCCFSTPVSPLRKKKIISTLSIPRNLHIKMKDVSKKHKYDHKIKKMKQKNLVLSFNQSSQLDISSIDFLSISAESFTKRCVNYDSKVNKKRKRHIVFLPKPFYKSSTDISIKDSMLRVSDEKSKNTLSDMASLVQTIFANDPNMIMSTDDSESLGFNDNFTMTEGHYCESNAVSKKPTPNRLCEDLKNDIITINEVKPMMNEIDQSESMITIDFLNKTSEIGKDKSNISPMSMVENKDDSNCEKNNSKTIKVKSKPYRNQPKINKRYKYRPYRRIAKFQKIQNRNFSFRCNKTMHSFVESSSFVDHWHNIIKYFSEDIKNDIKLDIHVNVMPIPEVNYNDNFTLTSNHDVNLSSTTMNETVVFNIKHSENKFLNQELNNDVPTICNQTANIIPILDGTMSNSKNIFKSSSENIQCSIQTDNNTVTSDHSTVTDLKLYEDIKELKRIIKDFTKAAEIFIFNSTDNNEHTETSAVNSNSKVLSDETEKQSNSFSVKISKDVKNNKVIEQLMNRMMKRSISYNVIDSELILKVTDMTSTTNKPKEVVSSKSIERSQSFVEIADEKKRKLLTYFCNPVLAMNTKKKKKGPDEFIYNTSDSVPSFTKTDGSHRDCSPVYYTFERDPKMPVDEEQGLCSKSIRPRRRHMSKREGCVYCIILWIPIIVIVTLFCIYVLQDYISENTGKNDDSDNTNMSKTTISQAYYMIRLADLGF